MPALEETPAPWDDPALARAALGASADDPALLALLALVRDSPAAMAYAHGPDHLLLYNEAYALLLGPLAHPGAYGCPAAVVFGDVWDLPGIGDRVAHVYRTGESYYEADTVLPLARATEEPQPATFTRAHSVVRDAGGAVAGMLTVALETTPTVTAIHSLSRLAVDLTDAVTVDEVVKTGLRHAVGEVGVPYVRLVLPLPSGSWSTVRLVADDLSDPATERLPPLWRDLPPMPRSRRAVADLDGVTGLSAWSSPRFDAGAAQTLQLWLDGAADQADRQVRSVAVFPLDLGDQTPAFLVYGRPDDGERHRTERPLLGGCADLVARALRRARAVDRERSAAQLLQRSLLPDTMPQPAGVLVAAHYEPGRDSQSVGGDFYDAFEVSGGRLALVVGDAMGQGVLAASVMGQVRAAIRAVALSDPDPAHVLDTSSRLLESVASSNDALASGHFVTVTYVLLDPATGTACVASAGHLPPLLRPHPGTARHAGARFVGVVPGPPLGIDGRRPTTDFTLGVGEALVLVTDGLIERRAASMTDSLADLRRTVTAFRGNDPMLLGSELIERYGPHTSDDVAVLVVSRTEGVFRTARTLLPADPMAVRLGRRWISEQLREWGVVGRRDDVAAALTEVVSNAVLHARTRSDVTLRHGDGQLLVTVTDSGDGGEAELQHVPGGSTRGRGLAIVDALTDAWGSQRTTSGQRVWFEVGV